MTFLKMVLNRKLIFCILFVFLVSFVSAQEEIPKETITDPLVTETYDMEEMVIEGFDLSNRDSWKNWYPATFITESFPGQFKNWFYSLIAMATVLEDSPPFKTVLGFATLLDEKGEAMHKSAGNAIEFNQGAEKIGVDVMRWAYLRQNPTNNLLFGYKTAEEVKRKFHLLLWNSYRFFANYAALENWQDSQSKPRQLAPLDKWILARLNQAINITSKSLDKFNSHHATKALEEFVLDLSTWYIRRSRSRIGPSAKASKDKNNCYWILNTCLTTVSRLIAPMAPYMADQIYTNLTGEDSVHLADWPEANKLTPQEQKLIEQMQTLRQIVEKGHAFRKLKSIKLRQPLASIAVTGFKDKLPANLSYLVLEELNIKSIKWGNKTGELEVKLDTKLTASLKAEGEARDIIRDIQQARKKEGTDLNEHVKVKLPAWPKDFEEQIKQATLASKLIKTSPKLSGKARYCSAVQIVRQIK